MNMKCDVNSMIIKMKKMPDSLYNWLLQNPDLIKYLQFDVNHHEHSVGDELLEEIKNDKLMIISSLINFNNLNFPTMLPKLTTSPSPVFSEYCPSIKRFISRISRFMAQYRYKIQARHYNHYLKLCDALISLFQGEDLLPPFLTCDLKETLFFTDALTPAHELAYIDAFFERNRCLCLYDRSRSLQFDEISNCINQIIEKCKSDFDQKNWFLPPHRKQSSFDAYILGQQPIQSPILMEVHEFLNTFQLFERKEFTVRLLKLFSNLIIAFQISEPQKISIFSSLFFRTIFSAAYSKAPEFFFPSNSGNSDTKYYVLRKKLTIKDLTPPMDLLPQKAEPQDLVYDVFNSNEHFQTIGKSLTNMVFHTNPFDILNEISTALAEIEKYVSKNKNYNDGAVLPFETVFCLFFGGTLNSDITDFANIAKFLEDFAPSDRLSSSFQYSLVTFEALYRQMNNFASNVH